MQVASYDATTNERLTASLRTPLLARLLPDASCGQRIEEPRASSPAFTRDHQDLGAPLALASGHASIPTIMTRNRPSRKTNRGPAGEIRSTRPETRNKTQGPKSQCPEPLTFAPRDTRDQIRATNPERPATGDDTHLRIYPSTLLRRLWRPERRAASELRRGSSDGRIRRRVGGRLGRRRGRLRFRWGRCRG